MSEFDHNTVEELECQNLLPQWKHITCPKLTKSVMKVDMIRPRPDLAFPIVTCHNLLQLEIYGYSRMVSSLPAILALLPDLESLKVGEEDGWRDVVLEHSCIKDLVFEKSKARSFTLIMPRLVRVDIGVTNLDMLNVTSTERIKIVTTDFSRSSNQLGTRRQVFRGGGMRIVDLSDAQ